MRRATADAVSIDRRARGVWRRLGRLPLDVSNAGWAATHAALPVVESVGPSTWAVYLSVRDVDGRARIGRAVLDLTPRPELSQIDPDPVLDLGPLGAFDDNGVTSSCIVAFDSRRYLFYTGWTRGVTVPFYLAAGIAVSEHGAPFTRMSFAPLLDRSAPDPFLTASPFVLVDGQAWRMWYISGTGWEETRQGPRHMYRVSYAESVDGLLWKRSGTVCLDYEEPDEFAFARPWVLRDGDIYRMWFASRGRRYQIGYADSKDGIQWNRHNHAGLGPALEGWDSEMVEYPCVFDWQDQRYMLYNGNDYGRTGLGLAVWDPSAP